MIQIIRFSASDLNLRKQSREIRFKVFVEEQHVPEELEYDEFENEAVHYLVVHNALSAATCRWRHTPKGIKLERFAVLKDFRGQGIGELLVKRVLEEVVQFQKTVYLHAQEQVTGFYMRLGFEASGPAFDEAGIRHFFMQYKPGSAK
jgi:predicted GNAT family N-acyltransferase